MKSRDNCFIGFPICWNMLVFTLFVMEPGWYIAFGVVIVSTALTFSPLLFVHPVRVKLWRPLTLSMLALWTLFGLLALYSWYFGMEVPSHAKVGIAVTGLYLYCIGFVQQFLGKVA
jgi:phosphatidylcholine synthase